MSVHVLYKGRLGNQLFQYVTARIFAERNGLTLATPFSYPEFVSMEPHAPGDWVELSGHNVMVRDGEDVVSKRPRGRYIFDGYFQDSDRIHSFRNEVDRFARVPAVKGGSPDDIVINLRLGDDYKAFGWVIDPSWYLGILERETFNRLHIVVDVFNAWYLEHFKKYNPVVIWSGPKADWEYLRKFSLIVCSNSTFCWWAAFFSKATKIYTFKRWVGAGVAKIGKFPNGVEVDGEFLRKI